MNKYNKTETDLQIQRTNYSDYWWGNKRGGRQNRSRGLRDTNYNV